jgi:hypothetical protein
MFSAPLAVSLERTGEAATREFAISVPLNGVELLTLIAAGPFSLHKPYRRLPALFYLFEMPLGNGTC